MLSPPSSAAAVAVQTHLLVHYFDHHRDVLLRYGGSFTLSPSSICLPVDSMTCGSGSGSGRKRKRSRTEVPCRTPELQWRAITELVAEEVAAQEPLNSDRALCSRTLFHCKQTILELRSLHQFMARFRCKGQGDEGTPSISRLEQDRDPTEAFTRLLYSPSSTVWASLMGRLAIPEDSAFSMGRISDVLRSMTGIVPCQQRYSVHIRFKSSCYQY